ncbi:hypothetical protein EXN61_01650 [Agrobacterium tumefaciens]|uniref:Abortive infection protein-like C-terminal domain-containing protein n=1 Tax=Agrobacterium tumefaciens TaxID=358 RepID=A0A546Y6N3_AGRTU|nr:hypothetical protein [Agrobacterium tumefaciens]TRB08661.1 hypothetical protein EXN61_01650 [Agrobacterium tumefaciens]
MAVVDLYSKRQRRIRGEVPDVYTYEQLPNSLRVQIGYIIKQGLNPSNDLDAGKVHSAFKFIVDTLRAEYGVHSLVDAIYRGCEPDFELLQFLSNEEDIDRCLDVVELSMRVVDKLTRTIDYCYYRAYNENADEVIQDLNTRFKEHCVGYQFIDGEIIRVDSELVHTEAVKPAIRLLNAKDYAGPHEEFLSAYEHYRHGNNKEALNDCLKAFESTMKAICDKRGWTYKTTDTAKALIEVCLSNGLVPPFWQQQMASLRSLLESSIPTGRNKLSGHGQGAVPQEVPDYLTAYMLHMTASTLVFLTTAEKELK